MSAPARSQPGTQEVITQLWMTDDSRTPSLQMG